MTTKQVKTPVRPVVQPAPVHPAAWAMLAKFAGDMASETRDCLPAGTDFGVDETLTVRLRGMVKVGNDTTAIVAPAVPVWRIIGSLLGRMNEKTARAALLAALDDESVDDKATKDHVAALVAEVKESTRQPRRGSVRVTFYEGKA